MNPSGEGELSDIAVDDIDVKDNRCGFDTPDDRCDFENGMCNYVNDHHADKMEWILHEMFEGQDEKVPTGRNFFLYMPQNDWQIPGDFARITSPTFRGTGQICIDFYLYHYGNIGDLAVSTQQVINEEVETEEVLKISGGQGPDWKRIQKTAQITAEEYKLIFIG